MDKKFFDAVRSGDGELINEAFEEVYEKYAKLIAFVVGKYFSDRETVKDIVNDAFIGLFDHAPNVKGSVKYYLIVSARNICINKAGKERREREYIKAAAEAFTPVYSGRSKVIAEMEKLPSKEEVNIIVAHVLEGYTFKEIASMTGRKLNTVLTVYSRAIKKFRKGADDLA